MVYIKNYNSPKIDRKEILRYAGIREENAEISSVLDSVLREIADKLSYRVCYRELCVSCEGEVLDLGFATVNSRSLSRALSGCQRIILFCATVGFEVDRLIAKYSVISPLRSLLLQAVGTERVEALCDAFCSDVTKEKAALGLSARPRFSPGYGDLPLALQTDVFWALDCTSKIGVSLSESLIMSPQKSVTAIIGISEKEILE